MTSIVDRDAWVDAAAAAFAAQGVEAVRVEPLARQLGVTKGSFYWHFADRDALLQAVLESWEQSATALVVASVAASGLGPTEQLELLVTRAFGRDARLERGIRAWATHDARALRLVRRVDRTRMAYLEELFAAHGVAAAAAAAHARVMYAAYVGEQHVAEPAEPEQRVATALLTLRALLAASGPRTTTALRRPAARRRKPRKKA
jgi:AcrR family transcriptional regulator